MTSWRWLSVLVIVCGFGMVAAWLGLQLRMAEERASMDAWLNHHHESPMLNMAQNAASATAEPDEGTPLGMLSVPRLELDVPVLAGTSDDVLKRGAGWIEGTSLPGGAGNAGIAGHRDTVFRPLEKIKVGDEIRFVSPHGIHSYRVQWIRIVEPRDTHVLDSAEANALTLVSCYPFRWIGPAPKRFIVRAEMPVNRTAFRQIPGQ